MKFKRINVDHEDIQQVLKLFNANAVNYVSKKIESHDVISFASDEDYDKAVRLLEVRNIPFQNK